MMYCHAPAQALFESISATANVGLSTGVTSPAMPTGPNLVYIVQMSAGRLEFLGFFTLMESAIAATRDSWGW